MTIKWTPGAPPDEMKDGREMLMWHRDEEVLVVRWLGDIWHCQLTDEWFGDEAFTHWSEANPPEVKP